LIVSIQQPTTDDLADKFGQNEHFLVTLTNTTPYTLILPPASGDNVRELQIPPGEDFTLYLSLEYMAHEDGNVVTSYTLTTTTMVTKRDVLILTLYIAASIKELDISASRQMVAAAEILSYDEFQQPIVIRRRERR